MPRTERDIATLYLLKVVTVSVVLAGGVLYFLDWLQH